MNRSLPIYKIQGTDFTEIKNEMSLDHIGLATFTSKGSYSYFNRLE